MSRPSRPKTPTISPSFFVDNKKPWRKRVPFDLVGRGVAGIEEMANFVNDNEIYFGLIQIKVGSGSFERSKNIFIHFNGENFPKPLLRSKLNKSEPMAQSLLSPFNAKLILENKEQCSIDYVFSKLKGLFAEDNIKKKGATKFEIGNLKDEYKKRMEDAKKLAKMEEERLKKMKERLRAKAEEERKRIENERRRAEEEERKRIEEIEEKKRMEEEEERKRQEEEERKRRQAEEEQKRLEQERIQRENELKEEERKKQEEAKKLKKPKKKFKKKKKKKKDDWSDKRPWTGKRVVNCIHQETSPMNWAVFKPSDSGIEPMKFGHGDLNDLRDALLDDQVQYGIMRLSFGEGRFRRSTWVFIVWSPDAMTQNVSQKLRKKRMDQRFKCVGYRGAMQKLIGPYSVEVLAEEREQVTLEDWILRVRKTVVVDGSDDWISAESFRKALEAEKQLMEELKRKREEEERKKKEAEEAAMSSDDEPILINTESKKKKKKKKKKRKSTADIDGDNEINGNDSENINDNNDGSSNVITKTEEQLRIEQEIEQKKREEEERKIQEEQARKAEQERIKREEQEALKKELEAKKKKERARQQKLADLDLKAESTYECVVLMKNPETNLTWVLLKPKPTTKK